jgi:hypothetical protein
MKKSLSGTRHITGDFPNMAANHARFRKIPDLSPGISPILVNDVTTPSSLDKRNFQNVQYHPPDCVIVI